MMSGCNKVDLEDRSKITITGNTLETIDLNRTDEVQGGEYEGPYGIECEAFIYKTAIRFALESWATLMINRMQQPDGVMIADGTSSVVGTECEFGVMANFSISDQGKALYTVEISSGTMDVENDEGTYDINFDFTISPASGGGKLTGNFTGTMEQADMR
ncbi:MAG TPA: hypothetical protein DCY25_01715 [Bacteroidales bacterium]|jgi:hypothetical protein|nr:hypothetical protein [Bacteroidales bacterium]